MKRREFALRLGTVPLLAHAGWAAAAPEEGQQYTRLAQPVPVGAPGKTEVIEFFGYWCPHCNDFEPALEEWIGKLPKTVNFRRIPVAWQKAHEPYQKLFFALQELGIGASIHARVFHAVHDLGMRFEDTAGISAFAAANGIDKVKLVDTMNGFSVASKVRMADQLWAAYHLDGVPTLAVNGRFATSPALAGGNGKALQVADQLMRIANAPGG